MRVVIDTNVIVSGLLNPSGAPGEIIDMIFSGQIEPVYDDRIISEYTTVLKRKKFGFPIDAVDEFVLAVRTLGARMVPVHRHVTLPDDADRCFIECALTTDTRIVITGNKKHFLPERLCGVSFFLPREFLERYRCE